MNELLRYKSYIKFIPVNFKITVCNCQRISVYCADWVYQLISAFDSISCGMFLYSN